MSGQAGPDSVSRRNLSLWLSVAGASLMAAVAVSSQMALPGTLALSLMAAAATLLAIAAGLIIWRFVQPRPKGAALPDGSAISAMLNALPTAGLITGRDLVLLRANDRARDLFDLSAGDAALLDALPAPLAKAMRDMTGAASRDTEARRLIQVADQDWTLGLRDLGASRLLWQFGPPARDADAAIAENLPVLGIDDDGRVLSANDRAAALLGGRPARLSDIFDGAVPAPGGTGHLRTPQGSIAVFMPPLSGAGARCDVALVPLDRAVADGAGEDDHYDDLPVPLLWISPDGRLQRANRQAMQLIGPDCQPGRHLSDLTEGLGRPVADWLDEVLSGHRSNSPEFLRVTATDRESFVQISLQPTTEKGQTSLLAVLNDATELKTLEAQFVQSQKMQAIGQLAGGVAHDFNNLLTAISGHCDLLLLRHDQGDPEYADLMQINQNANRAAALVSQLLAFSRKQTLRPEEIDLRETISDLTHLLNRLVGEKITLTFSHDPVLRTIRADKRQLEQALMNLVVNARDAIRGKGEIRIVTESITHETAQIRDRATVPPGEYVSVKVIDTGSGIPADKLTKVFEPFYTTKRVGEGTGLGLSTVYGIIKQTGGFIFADSVVDEGTCFTLLFRASKSDQTPMEKIQKPAQAPARHVDGVVLLVEDEAPVRAFASRALRLRGYTVLEAESGEDALAILEDPDVKVDIFVSDVVMPGLNGPAWVRRALETRPDVRVIFMSGYAEENFGEDQARIPNSVFLPKPFSLAELTRTVQGEVGQIDA